MKKIFLFIALFVVPILVYLFFASGVNSFVKLPTITQHIPELTYEKTNSEKQIEFKNHVTLLTFINDITPQVKHNLVNLCHNVYAKNKKYQDLQVVVIAPLAIENKVDVFEKELARGSDLSTWHFVYKSPEEIELFYKQLNLKNNLLDLNSPFVFIVDKQLALRGRKGNNPEGIEEYKEGYFMKELTDLNNEMDDDVKVVLAEYHLATKKNYRIENNK